MGFWQDLKTWLGISKPTGRKGVVEDFLEAHVAEFTSLASRQAARKQLKGQYFQRLKGWARPTDNDDDPINDYEGKLPVWADLSIDIWEAPGGEKGYRLNIFVTETDLTQWVLSIDSKDGSLGWTEIIPTILP